MTRAILIVLDSAGCGGAPDAEAFGDTGANTLGHIIEACAAGRADTDREGPLAVPHLDTLGLGAAVRHATGIATPGLAAAPDGAWAVAQEVSKGKDTPSGHWELAGVPVPFDWHYFPKEIPTFPDALVDRIITEGHIPGILGNCHAPGIPIVAELGGDSVTSGKPICYTSVDSVFQIAAHETSFGLDRLYALCETVARIVHPMRVGRVIARPFEGDETAGFTRTANRRDFAMTPPEPTLLNRVEAASGTVHAIGKIGDIFAGSGVTRRLKGRSDADHVALTLEALRTAEDGDLIFTNLVDFDTLYGHSRDVAGYARNLEAFDAQLPALLAALRPGDLLAITADHGNDPTWPGTDHTRECVPVLISGPGIAATGLGTIGFADVGETLAAHLDLAPGPHGTSHLHRINRS